MRSIILSCCLSALLVGTAGSPCRAQTTTTFDVLVATGSLTVIGTTTLQGNAFAIGNSSFVVNQGNIGIGTTTPRALLHMLGGLINGTTAQLQWLAPLGALRSGGDNASLWDPTSVGIFSVAFGLDNLASKDYTAVGGGWNNKAQGNYSVVAGGEHNWTGFNEYSSILGGFANATSGARTTVGGGYANSATGDYSTIGGGYNNATGVGAVVGGGGADGADVYGNSAQGGASAIVGGMRNIAPGFHSFIGGGKQNFASGSHSTIAGGFFNLASGNYSAIAGGYSNVASGDYSFAAGQQSSATTPGSFVWSDSQNIPFVSVVQDEFKARAQGGFVFYSTWAAPTVIVSSGAILISTSATAATAVPNIFISSTSGNVGIATMSFLTGGLFHIAAPANTHTYYDLDRVSQSYDSALTWATNAYRRWYLGFLPSAGSANSDLAIFNTAAGRVVQSYQDSTGNVGIGTINPATSLDVSGSAQFGSTAKSTFSSTGDLSIAPGAALLLSGANGTVTTASSITASAFFGDASHLTGIPTPISGLSVGQITVATSSNAIGNSIVTTDGNGVGVGISTIQAKLSVFSSTQIQPTAIYSTVGVSSFTVPSGIHGIYVKAWGAGGGAGGSTNVHSGGSGAGGGFAAGYIPVIPGEILTVIVGGSGNPGVAHSSSGYANGGIGGFGLSSSGGGVGGNGGNGYTSGTQPVGGGGGAGGASGVLLVINSTSPLIVAGGGAGGGGMAQSFNGNSASASSCSGTTCKANATGEVGQSCAVQSACAGGGGGGGGGTLGGVGGGYSSGGGFAGYTGNSIGDQLTVGNGTAAANNFDPDYSGFGIGGSSVTTPISASSGAVFIYYNTPQNTLFSVNTTSTSALTVLNNGKVGIGTSFPMDAFILASGNMGIGTEVPLATLDISGTLRVTSTATIDGLSVSTFSASSVTLAGVTVGNLNVDTLASIDQVSASSATISSLTVTDQILLPAQTLSMVPRPLAILNGGLSAAAPGTLTTAIVGLENIPQTITFSTISYNIANPVTPGTYKVCIYDEANTTLLLNATSATNHGGLNTIAVSPPMTLQAGNYYFLIGWATTATGTTLNKWGSNALAGFDTGSMGRAIQGTVTRASGACDATLGTITPAANDSPIIRLDN